MKKYIKIMSVLLGLFSLAAVGGSIYVANILPDTFSVLQGKKLSFTSDLPVVAECNTTQKSVAVSASVKAGNVYSTEIMLFGIIPVKQVTVDVVNETYVIPGGEPFGIKLYTEGVMIVGMSDVDSPNGPDNPAYDAGVRVGDIIMALNGKAVSTNDEVAKIFSSSGGKAVKINYKRGTVAYSVSVTPVKSVSENTYKAGLWVRDSTAGIGTLTFFSPSTGVFAGLGHGVCDVDTGEIMPLSEGDIVKASINGITKGTKGTPGELKGFFVSETAWGQLYTNTETGVYGVINGYLQGKAIPVAMKQQVHQGVAYILVTLNGSAPQQYSVTIERVHFNDSGETKNMIIQVTDPKLLEATGGIVQGMSGSPIIQDGRLVGAVTHVFVNDPTRGYGIFAENMINTVKSIEIQYHKDVS
ncbi:MAG: SpoIVB peptidase [Clostridia bacterium]|nr:SpoIVB peptidase [Clostridia bacterium]